MTIFSQKQFNSFKFCIKNLQHNMKQNPINYSIYRINYTLIIIVAWEIKFKMGNNHQLLMTWSIKFVQNLDDSNFGNIDIYKNDQGQFLMSMRRTFMQAKEQIQPRLQEFMEFMQCAKSQESFFSSKYSEALSDKQQNGILAPILHLNKSIGTICHKIEKNICLSYEIYEIYTEYFNFTLADMIKCKKQMDSDQLWLCFKWMLKMGNLLLKKGWCFSENTGYLKKIFITLKGFPIIYFYHLQRATKNYEPEEELQPDFIPTHKKLNTEQQILYEIALSILQLACMTEISRFQNMQLFLRKCTKIDESLGSILNQILNNIQTNPSLTLANLKNVVQELEKDKKIILATSIRLNKFRYAIPKPEPPQKKSHQEKISEKYQSKTQSPFDSRIKMLNGRKNAMKKNQFKASNKTQTEQYSERSSAKKSQKSHKYQQNTRRKILSTLQSKGLNQIENHENKALLFALNKTSKQGNLFASFKDQFAQNKKKIEQQREKMSERRQQIMRNNSSISSNKENMLSNSAYSNKHQISIRNSYHKNTQKYNSSCKNRKNIRQSFNNTIMKR